MLGSYAGAVTAAGPVPDSSVVMRAHWVLPDLRAGLLLVCRARPEYLQRPGLPGFLVCRHRARTPYRASAAAYLDLAVAPSPVAPGLVGGRWS